MTEAERIGRAHRAKSAMEEFLSPMFAELRSAYSERLVDVANTELNRDKRTDKITALSHALKVVNTLESGMQAVIQDGDIASREKLKVDRIERMTAPQRKLLGIAPY